jgi:shikimate dehydrogenase
VDILINATSIGQLDTDAEIPLDVATLRPEMLVADIVTNPPPFTRLIRDAEERGCATLTGLEMLVNQGALDLQIWTGCEPDRAAMREAVEEFLEI